MRAGGARLPLLVLAASVVVACQTTLPCGSATCEGCCDSTGRCLSGTAVASCGAMGVACLTCSLGQACLGGSCESPAPCTHPEDCPTTHCVCGDSTLVSSRTCAGGRCGADCDGACIAAGHPKPGDVPDAGRAFSMCVAGTQASCFGDDLEWVGTQCCVATGYSMCVDGTAAGCFGDALEWTGATCCVKSAYGACGPGTAQACTGDELAWTGTSCCVNGAYQLCTDGLATSCAVDGLLWTGTKCCALAEYTQCVDGDGQDCQGANLRWTGSQCCVKNRAACAVGGKDTCSGDWTGTQCCQ